MAVRGDGQNFPLRESYPQWYPPHCSPPDVVPYRLRRTRTWWWTGPPLTGGVWGGRIYDRNKTCRSSKTLLRGTAAYWEPLRSLHVESCTYNTRQVQIFFKKRGKKLSTFIGDSTYTRAPPNYRSPLRSNHQTIEQKKKYSNKWSDLMCVIDIFID
jgi:hypothetical protein